DLRMDGGRHRLGAYRTPVDPGANAASRGLPPANCPVRRTTVPFWRATRFANPDHHPIVRTAGARRTFPIELATFRLFAQRQRVRRPHLEVRFAARNSAARHTATSRVGPEPPSLRLERVWLAPSPRIATRVPSGRD